MVARLKRNFPNKFYISWRKAIRRLWKIPYRTHNKFIHITNNCMPIDVTLRKRCIKYLWDLIYMYSNCILYNTGTIVKLYLNNVDITIDENIRFFMYIYIYIYIYICVCNIQEYVM